MSNDTLSEQLFQAFHACATDTATPEQVAMREAVLNVLEGNINDPSVVGLVSKSVGSFATVFDREWSDLNPIQKWVREEASNADRAAPALGSMNAVYKALVVAEKSSGAGLNLGNGINIVAVDKEGRRWLLPRVSEDAVDAVRAAETKKEAKLVLSSSGSTRFAWSIERSFLVPTPEGLKDRLPLPEGGSYLVIQRGDPNIITKGKFKRAFAALAAECPITDFLSWDQSTQPATLWSVRGGIGHSAGTDIGQWPEHLAETASRMKAFLR